MNDRLSESIVTSVAEDAGHRLTRRVISALQRMEAPIHSGDDSGLVSVWEEICVQVQCDRSIFWDFYEELAFEILGELVAQLPRHQLEALWLQTESGIEWSDQEPGDREEHPVVYGPDVTDYVLQGYLWVQAGSWTNKRIRAYLGL